MIPKFREWDAERENIMPGKGMSYGKREDSDDAFLIRFDHMEDLDLINNDGSIDRVVMMSTGLFDLDGNEIYIGDILKMEDGYTQVVFHEDNTTYGIYLEDKEGGGNPISDYSTRISLNHIKGTIKGNIYEHPHLLEE